MIFYQYDYFRQSTPKQSKKWPGGTIILTGYLESRGSIGLAPFEHWQSFQLLFLYAHLQ